jgi:TadE-like protein
VGFLKNNRGTTALEFGLVALPVIWFVFGIIQTAWIVWIENTLYISVDTAARCGAIGSTTPPCNGSGTVHMTETANRVFGMTSGAAPPAFSSNPTCSGVGLVGTYDVSIVSVVNLTLTAKSCYPT